MKSKIAVVEKMIFLKVINKDIVSRKSSVTYVKVCILGQGIHFYVLFEI